jgi:hypothetical protein
VARFGLMHAEMPKGGATMSRFAWREQLLAGGLLAGLVGIALIAPVAAQQTSAPPDFSSNFAGWVGFNGGGPFFEPVPGSRMPGPIVSDPKYPFVPNGVGAQPTYRIPDLSNPNLKPWVKEHMRRDSEEIIAGKKPAFTAQSSCWPAGVPFFMGYGGPDPLVFIQTPKQVRIMWREDNQSRRVSMDVPHSANLKPSWYGESVGRYEGDTLVVDTIGLSTKTVVDIYRTPHTEKLHVVERWQMTDGGKGMQVIFMVEDPDTYYEPWTGMRRYRRVEQEGYEKICAEGNRHLFNWKMPTAETADF